jgi:hypothetical protein
MTDLANLPDVGILPSVNESGTGYRERAWFPVPVHAVSEAENGFAKLAAKCAKRLKTPAPVLLWQARGMYEVRRYWKDEDGVEHSRARNAPCYFASIEGTRPKIAGWTLAARMQTLATGERVTRNVPGIEIPDRVRELGPMVCEHCNASRFRKDVFAVLNVDSGECKQVGSTCLRDFLGHDPAAILNAWNACEIVESQGAEFFGGYGLRDVPMYPTQEVLELAACSIRLESWISRKVSDESGKVATAGVVSRLLHPASLSKSTRELYEVHSVTGEVQAVTDSDRAQARDALAWARKLAGENDYEKNMLAATRHDSCDARTLGLVCSAIAGYLRHVSRAAELDLKRSANAASVHVGAVKERLRNVPVTVEHMQHIESDFGGCTLYKFRDASGNLLSWFASGRAESVRPGDSVALTGTVKKHTEYKGTKETQLNRCVLVKARVPETV